MSIGIVQTKFGKVRGAESADPKYQGVTCFKSIPYAAPPVGDLRWKPPVDHDSWDEVLDCTEYGPRPMQVRIAGLAFEPYNSDFYYMGYPKNMSEDCLYMSITTAAKAAGEKRPVYVWFHGGGLADGYYYEIEFNGEELARKGIIVVSVGQRLNVFGYCSLPQLAAEQGGSSGNYGLMDEIKALDWVYENIEAFGGDPDNITVGGQSGGTMKSGTLIASTKSQGRAKRIINESALCWRRRLSSMEDYEKVCQEYIKSLGFDPGASIDELRAIPADKLLARNEDGSSPRIPSGVVCDGVYMTEPDLADAMDKYAKNVDFLAGSNYGESMFRTGFAIGPQAPATRESVLTAAKEIMGGLYEKYDFESISQLTDENADHRSRWLASLGLAGRGGISENRYFGARRARLGHSGKTYSFIFSRVTPDRPEDKGTRRDADRLLAWHSSELWYTFSSLRKGEPPCRPWTDVDFRVADQASSYWANFIRTGDPNGEGLPYWPASDEGLGWMELGDEPKGHEGIEGKLDELSFEVKKLDPSLPL